MTPYFNATNTPTVEQRRVAIEACILAAIQESDRALRVDEIRKFVMAQLGFEDTPIAAITEAINRLRSRKRIVMVWQNMRTIPSFGLPKDPESPFVPHALASLPPAVVDRRIIESMIWPRFFHIPSKEDLLPHFKMRTGYDVRVDLAM